MEPEIEQAENSLAPLQKVTLVSKYLALALFIIMPFIGGWIGYTYAPEKVVGIERVVEVFVEKEEAEVVLATSSMKIFQKDQRYTTDGVHVYFTDDLDRSDGDLDPITSVMSKADPATFEPKIVESFAVAQGNTYRSWVSRDKNYVFYQDQIIDGADPVTFTFDEEVPITKDVDDVFLDFKILPNADPETYKVIFNTSTTFLGKVFGQDKNNCYLNYEILDCAKLPATMEEAINFVG